MRKKPLVKKPVEYSNLEEGSKPKQDRRKPGSKTLIRAFKVGPYAYKFDEWPFTENTNGSGFVCGTCRVKRKCKNALTSHIKMVYMGKFFL